MIPLSTLLKSGFTPTLQDFNNSLLFLSRNQRFKAIIHLFSQLTSNSINADAQTHTIFTKALLKEHKFEQAADFLKTLLGKSEIFDKNRIFDALVQGLCTFSRDPDRGLLVLKDLLKKDGFFPSSRTFCLLICCFSRMGEMDRVVDLLEMMSDDKFKYPFDNYVCSSVISGFVRIGEPDFAVGFYENVVKSGCLSPNTVTCTSVLSAYCKLGYMDKVSDVVGWMEDNYLGFDVVFYSNWMYGCFGEGLIHDAFQKVRTMVDRKVEMDNISYTILIDGISKEGNVEKAVGLLYKMRRYGLEPNLVTYTAIILGFCNKGKLDEALAVFSMLKTLGIEADEITYAILIHGVCRKGDFDLVFQLLDEMEKKGINPGVVTYNTVINGLCKAGRTSEADDFSKGIVGDVVTYSTLLQGYVQEQSASGILETKRRLEAANVHMDVVMCNILIKALLMVGLFEDALAIYNRLPQMNLSANLVTYSTLINGFFKADRIDEALEVFDDYRKTSNSSAVCYSCILSGLCKKGMVDMAIDVFSEYIKKGLPLDRNMYMTLIESTLDTNGAEGVLNVIHRMEQFGHPELHAVCGDAISFLCKMGSPEASYNILLVMRRKGLELVSTCYYPILSALLFGGKIQLAQLIFALCIKIYGMSDPTVREILVYYLCLNDVRKALVFLSAINEKKLSITIPATVFVTITNNGKVLDAYELLMATENNLTDMNVVDYTIMIDALCKGRHMNKALDLCLLAKKKGIALNIVTYNSVIHGLCLQGYLVEAFRLFDSLEKINIVPSAITYGTLIDALVKEGHVPDAKVLFDRMFLKNLNPGTHIYNSLINGCCKSNLLEEGLKLFQELELRNLEPDGFTVGALINGYCQKGDMEGALKLFFEFQSKGLLPDFLGFMYLIRGLCAKGRMEESRSILREMLKDQSVIDLLRRVNAEVESDSVDNLLVFLCERGNIQEAVAVLEEVGSLFFSAGRNSSQSEFGSCELEADTGSTSSIYAGNNICPVSSDGENLETVLNVCANEDGNIQQFEDFDSFYAVIRSHCFKGEIAKANRLTKLFMEL